MKRAIVTFALAVAASTLAIIITYSRRPSDAHAQRDAAIQVTPHAPLPLLPPRGFQQERKGSVKPLPPPKRITIPAEAPASNDATAPLVAQVVRSYQEFVRRARPTETQEETLKALLWNAQQNLAVAKEEEGRQYVETLQGFASREENGQRLMTKDDWTRYKHYVRDHAAERDVSGQAFLTINDELNAKMKEVLSPEQYVVFQDTLTLPAFAAMLMPFSVQ